jgi:excinuclease ABC subunit A
VEHGHTLVIIEHNLDLIKLADWVVDLGPEGGAGGGSVVAMGRPEEVAQVEGSYTGQWLKGVLAPLATGRAARTVSSRAAQRIAAS